jgi:hypothetical protein
MKALLDHLNGINNILNSLNMTDVRNLTDMKSLKSLACAIDKTMHVLNVEISNLGQLRLATLAKIAASVDEFKPALRAAEEKFLTRYATSPIVGMVPVEPTVLEINIGNGVIFKTTLYLKREHIPVLGYGAVMNPRDSRAMVLFRYNQRDFVSCSAFQIIDFSNHMDNYRTVCCGNTGSCEYGSACKYYHDPAVWPDSDHTQRFMRTMMVKKCPMFGDSDLIADQRDALTFDSLRTLARYCANMMLLISLIES